jgi:hypothetical protein
MGYKERINMHLVATKNNVYKSIKENGYTDFPTINARVMYYYDHWTNQEYAVTINLDDLNSVIDIEKFKSD